MVNHMVNHGSKTLDVTLAAIKSPVRRHMLTLLSTHDYPVGELAARFNMTPPGASKHIARLEKAGLVSRRKSGRQHTIQIEPEPLREVAEWVNEFHIFWLRREPRAEQTAVSSSYAGT